MSIWIRIVEAERGKTPRSENTLANGLVERRADGKWDREVHDNRTPGASRRVEFSVANRRHSPRYE